MIGRPSRTGMAPTAQPASSAEAKSLQVSQPTRLSLAGLKKSDEELNTGGSVNACHHLNKEGHNGGLGPAFFTLDPDDGPLSPLFGPLSPASLNEHGPFELSCTEDNSGQEITSPHPLHGGRQPVAPKCGLSTFIRRP